MQNPAPLVAALLVLAGCVAPSVYHPLQDGIGFTDEQVSEKVYRVSFHGDEKTSQDTVEDMLLLRMAEVTDKAGMDHFTVVIDDTVCETVVKTSPTTSCKYTRSTEESLGFALLTESLLSEEGLVSKSYEATATFIVGRGTVTSDTPVNYVAKDVISRLECLKSPDGC